MAKRKNSENVKNANDATDSENADAPIQEAEPKRPKRRRTVPAKVKNAKDPTIDEDAEAPIEQTNEKRPKRRRNVSAKVKNAQDPTISEDEDLFQKIEKKKPKRKRTVTEKIKNSEDTTINEDTEALIKRAKETGQAPLVLAIIENKTGIFRKLLDDGHKLTAKMTNTPMTPLHYAAQNGNLEIVKMLFDNGYNKFKVKKGNKETPLFFAVENRHVEVVKYLIDNGDKDNLSNPEIHDFVRKSIENDCLDIVKCLINSSEGIDEQDSLSETLLHHAASFGRLDMVKYLIEIGANVHVKTDYNETPLHYAIRKQHVEIVRELLKIGQTRETVYDSLFNDLSMHTAAKIGNEEIFRTLLEAGYSINCVVKKKTPIHVAAEFGHSKLVEMLIKLGVDVDSLTDNGKTPLCFAIMSGDYSTVRFLLEAGASATGKIQYRPVPISFIINKEKWKADVPLKVMIDRQVEILRCLLNHVPREALQKCVISALRDTSFKNTPIKLIYVLLEYNADLQDPALSSSYEDGKSLAALVDDTVHLETLVKPLNDMVQYRMQDDDSPKRRFFRETLIARIAVVLSVSEDPQVENDLNKFCQFGVKDRYGECKKQLERMKETIIHEKSNVTYYDMISKPIDNVANFVKDENVITALESSYDKFSAYSSILETRVEKAKQRQLLLDASVDCFFKIVDKNCNIKLPRLIIMSVFALLSAVDLRKLIEACS